MPKMNFTEVYIIDFDDSFTFNIASSLNGLGLNIEVLHYSKIENMFSHLNNNQKKVIVWGPGPKHPNDYINVHESIKLLRENSQVFHMGICLGHQILLQMDGYSISRSQKIIHGRTVPITIPEWNDRFIKDHIGRAIEVQRYNSLAGRSHLESSDLVLDEKHEILMYRFKNGISYQFHPESVGTSCPDLFFDPITKFLYNSMDEQFTQTHRNLRSELNSISYS